ncbi:hypothetical protein MMC25_003041 [Agyrium rufum]|nr:hypothetical protein [Agyrium rufum]
MKLLNYAASLLGLAATVSGLGQKASLTFSPMKGAIQLSGGKMTPQIILDSADWAGVIRTANDLSHDFGRITGINATVLTMGSSKGPQPTIKSGNPVIIAGTIGKSSLIDSMISSKKIDVSKVKGQWEAFMSQVVQDPMTGVASALVIAGSDKRGSIYGMYDVSEQMGVSPWYWWADVAPQTKEAVYAMPMTKVQASPTVKFRGLFINDEQPALTNWVNKNYPMGKYGPGFNAPFYENVFELLLRLRANYLWPAEWNSMFNVDDPKNEATADMYGIFMGTSHTEPLMRATKEQSLFLNGVWSWSTNEQNVTDFMRAGAKRAQPYEGVYTMGMRGLGDTASPTLNASSLQQIIQVEQQILRDTFNTTDLSNIPQMWCLYKEVGTYFQQGLSVPEDITLLWADDNWGNNQRLPLTNETSRSGGAGVYYHFDYVGAPRNYKWINTIQLTKTWEQMHLAYQRQARTIWIVNVGDLKTLEQPISHWFDMAYDMTMFQTPESTSDWLQMWATREFGAKVADATASIMSTYGMLAARRKYELMDPTIYSNLNYNESAYVLGQWQDLASQAQTVYDSLPKAAQPSFFEMVWQPVTSGYTLYQIYITAGLNNAYAEQRRTSANVLAQNTLQAFAEDATITKMYHTLLGGKWNHILDQTHFGYDWFQQPERNTAPSLGYVQETEIGLAGNMGVSVEASNGSIPGDSTYNVANSDPTLNLPAIDTYGPNRWIDIYSRGTGAFTFNVSTGASYVKATPSTGTVKADGKSDVRVIISVDWSKAPAGSSSLLMNVTSSDDYGSYNMPTIMLPVNNTKVPSGFHGFVESDGHISIEAEHTTKNTSTKAVSYGVIPSYGRTLSGVTLFPVTADSQTAPDGPMLQYSMYVFTKTLANITVYTSPSLNTIPARPLAYAISVDDGKPSTVYLTPTYTLGALPTAWNTAVSNAVWQNTTSAAVTPGAHTLNLWALEPGVVFQKIVVDMGGVRPSYLGPPESMIV